MPDPLSHSYDMINLTPQIPLPRFWWLSPWAIVIEQRRNMRYLETIRWLDDRIIRRQDDEIKELNAGIERFVGLLNRRPPAE